MDREEAERLVATRAYWHHTFEIHPGVRTRGNYDPEPMWNVLDIPSDLRGMTVLDIGPSDGYFSMMMARRGAAVTCVDYRAKETHGFGLMEQISGYRFDYHQCNVYDVPNLKLGRFDIVLFLGVLYHLPDMMRALKIIKDLCKSRLYIETAYEPELTPGIAAARYYEANSLNDDYTNFWSPNRECVLAMLADAGLKARWDRDHNRRLVVEARVDSLEPTFKMKIGYGVAE